MKVSSKIATLALVLAVSVMAASGVAAQTPTPRPTPINPASSLRLTGKSAPHFSAAVIADQYDLLEHRAPVPLTVASLEPPVENKPTIEESSERNGITSPPHLVLIRSRTTRHSIPH